MSAQDRYRPVVAPTQQGQGVVLAPATTDTRYRLLQWSAPSGAPERVTVATQGRYVSPIGVQTSLPHVEVLAGVGGTRLRYDIDVGESLTVNAETLSVTLVVASARLAADCDIRATVAPGGDRRAVFTSERALLPAGGSVATLPPPSGATEIMVVGAPDPLVSLQLQVTGPVWWAIPCDLPDSLRRGIPLPPLVVGAQLISTSATGREYAVQWRVAG